MGSLIVNLLGSFTITVEQQPVAPFRTDKVRALLAYLAVETRPHRRAALAALLWPDISESYAEKNLRNTLHRLRQPIQALDSALVDQLVVSSRQTIALDPAYFVADVARFTALISVSAAHARHEQAVAEEHYAQCPACLARLTEAADLYQGELLAGFSLADAPAFEEWLLLRREALHQQLIILLFDLATASLARAAWKPAQHYARRLLALEPWREEGHRLLMQILAQSGQRSAALAQYEQCRQVLMAELGVEPDRQTVALEEQIRHAVAEPSLSGQTVQPPSALQPSAAHQPPAPPHNLPATFTPLIGRTQALAEVANYLQHQGVRLLTLVGPGGMGKTRLALEIGREQLTRFADGVFFVPLAAISTVTELVTAIAIEIGLRPEGNDPLQSLLQAMRPKQMLLILDNFEHLLAPGAETVAPVVALLTGAPQMQIIVTSRERLNLRGEQIYHVSGLAFAAQATLVEAAALPAVTLFAQSVQRVQANFQLNQRNLAAVLRICQLVQGMPLGLELATAYVGSLPLAEIAAEIEQSVEFLRVEWRDLPPRQRSMRAVFDWSWRLLDDQERQVLRQLALFQGGFTRTAAAAVTGATLPVLTRLVHKSLLQWHEDAGAEGRYTIHELLRQFARSELTDDQDLQAVANRHCAYYLTFAAGQVQKILHDAPDAAVQTLQGEIDNIRQAWRWGVGAVAGAPLEQSALALCEYYRLTRLRVEGREMFALALNARQAQLLAVQAVSGANQQAEEQLCSLLCCHLASMHILLSQHEEAFRLASTGLQLAQRSGSAAGVAYGTLTQGQALRRQGQTTAAYDLLTQAAHLAQAARDDHPQDVALLVDIEYRAYHWLVSIALINADYAQARAYAATHLALCQRFEKTVAQIMALADLSDIHRELGDFRLVRYYAEEALAAARKVNFRPGEAICFESFAASAWAQGDCGEALQWYKQLLVINQETVHPLERAAVLYQLARLYSRLGANDRAQAAIEESFRLLTALNFPAYETLVATWARFWLAYQSGDLTQAQAAVEQGLTMARQNFGGASQAYGVTLLGLVYESRHQAAAAKNAYQEALTTYLTLELTLFTVEPRAGLARLALATGDPAGAQAEIEAILPILQQEPLAGFDEPFQVYWSCYSVLAANHDPRAVTLLQTAKHLLDSYVERIPEPALRQSFLENVAVHRALWQADQPLIVTSGERLTLRTRQKSAVKAPL